jgi:hypothetical protein
MHAKLFEGAALGLDGPQGAKLKPSGRVFPRGRQQVLLQPSVACPMTHIQQLAAVLLTFLPLLLLLQPPPLLPHSCR